MLTRRSGRKFSASWYVVRRAFASPLFVMDPQRRSIGPPLQRTSLVGIEICSCIREKRYILCMETGSETMQNSNTYNSEAMREPFEYMASACLMRSASLDSMFNRSWKSVSVLECKPQEAVEYAILKCLESEVRNIYAREVGPIRKR
jgi:hypothetical protein